MFLQSPHNTLINLSAQVKWGPPEGEPDDYPPARGTQRRATLKCSPESPRLPALSTSPLLPQPFLFPTCTRA